MARLFVAAWPPDDVVELIRALPRPDHEAVRWTTPEQWHVTLRFLGDADPAEVGAALAGVGAHRTRAEMGPATARLNRAVLTVPVAGLDDVAAAVVAATAGLGRPPEDRPFRGHLTLARGRNRRPVPAALAGAPLAGGWDVGEVTLVASHLHPRGARYEVVRAVPLA